MLGFIAYLVCALLLVAGYLWYGRLAEKVYGVDMKMTMPCVSKADGVDFVPLPMWKIFLIQLLNIAGLGPVVGAISGCLFGAALDCGGLHLCRRHARFPLRRHVG